MLVSVLHETEFHGRLMSGYGESSIQSFTKISRPRAALKAWPNEGHRRPSQGHWGPARALFTSDIPGRAWSHLSCPSSCCTANGLPYPLSWFLTKRLHSIGRALFNLVYLQLPAFPPRGDSTFETPSWASGCGWSPGPKAKTCWAGLTDKPKVAPHPSSGECHRARTHSSARGHSQTPQGLDPELRY